jgi:hypothetical protein
MQTIKTMWKAIFQNKLTIYKANLPSFVQKIIKKSLLCKLISQTSVEKPPKNGGVRKANSVEIWSWNDWIIVLHVTMSHTDSELAMLYVSFVDKNSKRFQLQIRLTNYEFSKNLLDKQSSQYKNLKTKLDNSVRKQITLQTIVYHIL